MVTTIRCRAARARAPAPARRPRLLLRALALVAWGVLGACAAGSAHAGGRFGDSTWVAPMLPDAGDTAAVGPRVAARDRERRWESALRAPFRVAFYPLHLLANAYEGGIGLLGPRFLDPQPPRPPRKGPRLGPAFSVGAVNDIGLGPGLDWAGLLTPDAELRASATWSRIDHRRAHLDWTSGSDTRLGLDVSAAREDKADEAEFGAGNASDVERGGIFRLETTELEASARIGRSLTRQLRVNGGYSSMSPGHGSHAEPLLEDVLAAAGEPVAFVSTRELWYGLSGDAAVLDDARDPSFGVHGRFDVRRAMGARPGDPDFDRWSLEGRGYLPVFAKRRVLALRAVYAGVEPRGGGAALPFYRLAQSEGAARFAGFSAGRFRDRQVIHGRIEYRWEIFRGASALALFDAGEVQPRAGLFRLRDAHVSTGGGLRVGLGEFAAVRAELANSVEGLHAVLLLGGDF